MAGHLSEAENAYTGVTDLQLRFDPEGMTQGNGPIAPYGPNLTTFLLLEKGQLAYDRHDYASAILEMTQSIEARAETGNTAGVQEHVISLSFFAMNRPDQALIWAEKALEADPFSPLYQEGIADAKRGMSSQNWPSGGGTTQAEAQERAEIIAAYRAALALNPSLFSAWNNLGVLLIQDGQTKAAIEAFTYAISARQDYGLGWFNLGVVEASRPGFMAFLRSQGALGRAGLLNHGLKGLDPVPTFDDEVYSSGLDVSKPIPADWQLAHTRRTVPTALAIGLISIIAIRLFRTLAEDWLSGRSTERVLTKLMVKTGPISRFAKWRPHPVWTTGISVVAVVWLAGASGVGETLACLAIAVCLFGLHALVPRIASGGGVRRSSFPPASLLTVLLAPFGVCFAPPAPLLTSGEIIESTPRLVRRLGVIVIAATAVLFGIGAWFTAVPIARTATTAALIIVGSALTPVSPLDGARMNLKKWVDHTITVAMTATTVLFVLQYL
jgi:hypothetical protein